MDVRLPSWLVQPAVFLLAAAAWHWLASHGGRRLSAADARRRLDAGGRVALREVPVPVLGRGVLVGGLSWLIVLWRVAIGLIVVLGVSGVLGAQEGSYSKVEAVRYGGGGGGKESLRLRQKMAESVSRLCRRNEAKRSVFYELYDPGNVLVPLDESDTKPGIVGRGFCAEPGNVRDEAELYDVQVDSPGVALPGGGETFDGLGKPVKGTVTAGGENLSVLVWGSVEKQTDKGSLVCPSGEDSRCLWLGDANENNERALVAVRGNRGSSDAGDVTIEKGFTSLTINMDRVSDGFLPRALLYLNNFSEEEQASNGAPEERTAVAAAETLQLLVIMDVVTATTIATVDRRIGSRGTTRLEPWALAALALLALLSFLQALIFCLPGHRSPPVSDYRFAVEELARCSEEKRRASRAVEKISEDWHVSEGPGGVRLLAYRESGCDRRSFVSVRTDV